MYVGRDFEPADPDESQPFTFDFTNDLATGETIVSAEWTCAVAADSVETDDDPMSRLAAGGPDNTYITTTQVVSTLLPGVRYVLTAAVTTSAGNTLSLWSHVHCIAPS